MPKEAKEAKQAKIANAAKAAKVAKDSKEAKETKVAVDREAIQRLSEFFNRNGYVRFLDETRRAKDGEHYKKGAEVRLVADSKAELTEIQRLLKRAGFKVAKPFSKSNQWRQPIYGVDAVARFLALVKTFKN
ncbi:MAG: hypothetical protein N2112_09085 [Gemmataceae bacterium]|jgi:ERCC4-type nuclease|nr:hypothetical protein [Gemmataceae bacterium]